MVYLGSKMCHARHIIPFIMADRKCGQPYVEPFVGGGNVIGQVPADGGPRTGADTNPYIVAMLSALAAGWEPPSAVSQDEYYAIKMNPGQFEPRLVGFVATACSFGGKWWGGYARNNETPPRDYCGVGRRRALREAPGLRGCTFVHADYRQLAFDDLSIIYCDPPYADVTDYSATGKFDSQEFWIWCDAKVRDGHSVFVSEYKAPDGWTSIWQKPVRVSIVSNRSKGATAVEQLFTRLP